MRFRSTGYKQQTTSTNRTQWETPNSTPAVAISRGRASRGRISISQSVSCNRSKVERATALSCRRIKVKEASRLDRANRTCETATPPRDDSQEESTRCFRSVPAARSAARAEHRRHALRNLQTAASHDVRCGLELQTNRSEGSGDKTERTVL